MGVGVLHDERATTVTNVNIDYKSLEELNINECQTGLLSLLETKLLSQLDISNFNDIQCLPNINRLQSLTLWNCPTLSSFPEDGLPTTLTSLSISYCRRLEFLMLAKLTSLDFLFIAKSCDSMRSFPLGIFPILTGLVIMDCPNLESISLIEEDGVDANLSHLEIADCPNLVCFPQGGSLTALQELKMYNLPNLESIAEDGGLPPNLRDFSIENCARLMASSSSVGNYCNWGLQRLVSLEQFTIGGRGSDEILETLLKQQLLPTNLQRLEISGLSTLKSLDGKGLKNITSLVILSIYNCCALEKTYKKKRGKDWANISHIPCIVINDEVII